MRHEKPRDGIIQVINCQVVIAFVFAHARWDVFTDVVHIFEKGLLNALTVQHFIGITLQYFVQLDLLCGSVYKSWLEICCFLL